MWADMLKLLYEQHPQKGYSEYLLWVQRREEVFVT